MKILKTLAIATAFALVSGASFAQSVGNGGNPGRANTTDPNSAPMMGQEGTRDRTTTTGRGLDATGRANTSDPNSAMSGGTDASGHPVNPMADPRQR